MGRASHYAMALSAALALGACADGAGDLSTAPSSPEFQTAANGGIVLTCAPSDLQKYARNLFGGRSPVLNQAKLITTKNANTGPALNAGYNVMASVAELREGTALGAWTSEQQTNATELTIQLIGCMDVQFSDPAITTVALLHSALMDALDPDDSGAYAVTDVATTAIFARNRAANLSMTGSGDPPGTFEAWLPGHDRVLLLGRGVATFATEISGGAAYDWMTVRKSGDSGYDGEGIVGLCPSSTAAQLRVEHLHGTHTILPFYTVGDIECPVVAGALDFPTARTFAGRMVQSLFALVQPKPLFASAAALGGPGGGVRLLSPFEVIDPVTVKVTFAQPPADVAVNVAVVDTLGNPIKVTVTGNLLTPWQGVDVTLSAVANNGDPLVVACGTGTTDSNGEVTFPALSVNKPGGMQLVATVHPTGDDDGTAFAGSTISDRFIVGPGDATAPACS